MDLFSRHTESGGGIGAVAAAIFVPAAVFRRDLFWSLVYCSSLVTSCCTLLAWAKAAMPVWLRISYFDMFELAAA